MIDIYHSRRTHYKKCYYYAKDESNGVDPAKYVIENKPSGVFFAKPSGMYTNRQNQINNVMLHNNDNITLETNDDINDIKVGYIVEYLDDLWFVENVQRTIHNQETEFSKENHSTYYLTLRK